uniref:Odorant receptor n=1 Tax=Ectropis obliqua TaxID=248899 RepID=A0A1L2BLB8_ECTOB|nr:odorant receptor 2 [Ectropis obliqua]
MSLICSQLKVSFKKIKNIFTESSFESLIAIVNFVPNLAGFSIRRKKIAAPFWILHLSLLLYVYGVGCLVYQIKVADGAEDFIKNFVNVSLLILIFNISWWWLNKRPLLLETLQLIENSDVEARTTEENLREKHNKMLHRIKIIVLIFYMTNCTNAACIYLPNRINVSNEYSMALCVGLEPITVTPNGQICSALLCIQELTIMIAVLNYQTLMLFIISHTATMYHMLAEELMSFNVYTNLAENQALVKERLPIFIKRHSMILSTCDNLKSLYSLSLGVDFGSNAICICLFFYLSLQEMVKYMPILIYCVLAFFLYCFLCQKLMTASEVFERAVYSCGWENFALNEKKMIYVMLRQAQKPVIILAADIVPVNMYTFATTLQTLFKFVTVVKL